MQQVINFFNPWYLGKYRFNKMPQSLRRYIKVPFFIFLAAFSIGNILFAAYLLIKAHFILKTGLLFFNIASLIHVAFIIAFIAYSFYHKQYTLLILQKTSVLVINIPVTIIYVYIILQIL